MQSTHKVSVHKDRFWKDTFSGSCFFERENSVIEVQNSIQNENTEIIIEVKRREITLQRHQEAQARVS